MNARRMVAITGGGRGPALELKSGLALAISMLRLSALKLKVFSAYLSK